MTRSPRAPRGWIDATEPIRSGLPAWPGDPRALVRPLAPRGRFRVSRLSLSTHAGTHVDPPYHVVFGPGSKAVRARVRRTVDEIAPEVLVGVAVVARSAARSLVPEADLAAALAQRPRRLLVRTGNSSRDFSSLVTEGDFVALSEAAARAVVRAGVRLLGIDGPSVDPAASRDHPAHRICLAAGCVLVEGLRLGRVRSGECDLLALPLRLLRGDGAPARVFVRPRG